MSVGPQLAVRGPHVELRIACCWQYDVQIRVADLSQRLIVTHIKSTGQRGSAIKYLYCGRASHMQRTQINYSAIEESNVYIVNVTTRAVCLKMENNTRAESRYLECKI